MIFIYLIDRAFLGLMVLEMLAKVVFEMHAFLNLPVLEMPCLYTTQLSTYHFTKFHHILFTP